MDPETKIDAAAPVQQRSFGAFLTRIGLILVAILFTAGSLLTFPGGLPWMILAWILVACIWLWRDRTPAWLLLVLLAVISIKNPEIGIGTKFFVSSSPNTNRFTGIRHKTVEIDIPIPDDKTTIIANITK